MSKLAFSLAFCLLLLLPAHWVLAADARLDEGEVTHKESEDSSSEILPACSNHGSAVVPRYAGELPFSYETPDKSDQLTDAYLSLRAIRLDFDEIDVAHFPSHPADGYASKEDFKKLRDRALGSAKNALASAEEWRAERWMRKSLGTLTAEEEKRLLDLERSLEGVARLYKRIAADYIFWLEENNWKLLSHAYLDHEEDKTVFSNAEQEIVFVSKRDVEALYPALKQRFCESRDGK